MIADFGLRISGLKFTNKKMVKDTGLNDCGFRIAELNEQKARGSNL